MFTLKSSIPSFEAWISATPKLKAGIFTNLFLNQALQWWMYIGSLLFLDFLMVGLGFRLAYVVRFNLFLPIFNLDIVPSLNYYESLSLTLIPIWIILFSLSGLYSKANLLGGTQEYAKVFRANTVGSYWPGARPSFWLPPGVSCCGGWSTRCACADFF
jgi:hypothetical protein